VGSACPAGGPGARMPSGSGPGGLRASGRGPP
jgi:hypothetical protein